MEGLRNGIRPGCAFEELSGRCCGQNAIIFSLILGRYSECPAKLEHWLPDHVGYLNFSLAAFQKSTRNEPWREQYTSQARELEYQFEIEFLPERQILFRAPWAQFAELRPPPGLPRRARGGRKHLYRLRLSSWNLHILNKVLYFNLPRSILKLAFFCILRGSSITCRCIWEPSSWWW